MEKGDEVVARYDYTAGRGDELSPRGDIVTEITGAEKGWGNLLNLGVKGWIVWLRSFKLCCKD